MVAVHNVRLEPVGIEFEVEEGETVLNAAFRQGISLPHGCKEGQCSACKCVLNDGDVDLLRYSTFALNEMERDTGHILLCRTLAYSDIEVDLLNYDEEVLSKSIAVKTFSGRITRIESLTHDIRGIGIKLDQPMKFWAGQYADITVTTEKGETITRSFSMANSPDETEELSFIIKKYPQGKFSGELDAGGIRLGAVVSVAGPYGTCFRRGGREGPVILVGAGSGMSPVWSILNDHLTSGEDRDVYFFYGARTENDLFYLDRIAALTAAHPSVHFIPVLSHADADSGWSGARGFVHEAVGATLKSLAIDGAGDVYACGPPPMIDALQPVLFMNGFDVERVFFDRFTTTTSVASAEPAQAAAQ
ncbi:NADH:ubiquinone reductase (Na(+)-transporting) subunit F [Segnochrobactrum spirostomi]|uniref:2Fe-2S iron-sulfur cluster binding domain-containing protein n=1 Tax=Segnochrobactrum spirostomi TaxID=2608987 RepID=A0A6A7Y695_9HYPH|nr:2Fe-2S iron-sulfur cluster binding domain-containing protein [Segnochrobactrum spirostomi]MQT14810.1 2Fe-2S iron-sulfur cluster binding domain-containing protein [Segnochrobactrum spirostomi]